LDYREQYYGKYFSTQVQPRGGLLSQQDQFNWIKGTLQRIQKWLPEDRHAPILDVGCGTGMLLSLYTQLGYKDLTGIDISPEQVALSKILCPEAAIVQDDVKEFLANKVEQYFLISAFDIIEHFRKDEIMPILALLFRALQPGGRLILQMPNAESPWFGSVAYGDFTHEWFFTPTGLEAVLCMTGFDQFQVCEITPYIHGAKSFLRFWLWRLIHTCLTYWNVVETGGAGSGIYSRVFIASVRKVV
jgi:SAM-dependent methyltransferase